MSTTGQFTASGNISGGQTPNETIGPNTQTFSAAVGVVQSVGLTNGALSVTVPTGATLMYFQPPNAVSPSPNPAYAGTITLKGVTGDTGWPVSNTFACYIPFDTATAPATVVFAATANGTGYVTFW